MNKIIITEEERSRILSLYNPLINEDSTSPSYVQNPQVVEGFRNIFNKWANLHVLKLKTIYSGQEEKKFDTYVLGERYVRIKYDITYGGGTLNTINANSFNINAIAKVNLDLDSDLIDLSNIDIPTIKANCNITCNYELIVGQNYELKITPIKMVISTNSIDIPKTYWKFWIKNNEIYVNFGKFLGMSMGTKNFGTINNYVELNKVMKTVNISGPKDSLDSLFNGKINPDKFGSFAKLIDLSSQIKVS